MIALLYHKEPPKENTIFAYMLSSEGKWLTVKFPHVLKSQRRNIYHLHAGTIWDLHSKNFEQEIIIPTEASVHLSPFTENPTYEELCLLAEMLEPLKIFPKGTEVPKLFSSLYQTILLWPKTDFFNKQTLVSKFYLDLLEELGFYYPELRCFACGSTEILPEAFLLSQGFLCPTCASKKTLHKDNRLLAKWILSLLLEKTIDSIEQEKARYYIRQVLKEMCFN